MKELTTGAAEIAFF